MKRVLQFFLFALWCVPVALAAQEQSLNLKWGAIPEAVEYRIEVVDVGLNPVLREKTTRTRLQFKLPPGDYHYRLASVDKLGRVSDWSKWKRLRILPVVPPTLSDERQYRFEIHGEADSILLRGKNFTDETELEFRSRRGVKVPILRRERIVGGGMRLFVDKDLARPGTYDLSMRNSGGKPRVVREFLYIPVPPEPVYNYWQPLIPGVYQLRGGEYRKGGVFLGSAIGLALVGGYNWVEANRLLDQKRSDILLNFYTNPVLFYAFQENLKSNISEHRLAAQFYFVQGSLLSDQIALHRSNYNALRAALGLLYVAHATDILEIGKDVTKHYAPGELSRPIVSGIVTGTDKNAQALFSLSFLF